MDQAGSLARSPARTPPGHQSGPGIKTHRRRKPRPPLTHEATQLRPSELSEPSLWPRLVHTASHRLDGPRSEQRCRRHRRRRACGGGRRSPCHVLPRWSPGGPSPVRRSPPSRFCGSRRHRWRPSGSTSRPRTRAPSRLPWAPGWARLGLGFSLFHPCAKRCSGAGQEACGRSQDRARVSCGIALKVGRCGAVRGPCIGSGCNASRRLPSSGRWDNCGRATPQRRQCAQRYTNGVSWGVCAIGRLTEVRDHRDRSLERGSFGK